MPILQMGAFNMPFFCARFLTTCKLVIPCVWLYLQDKFTGMKRTLLLALTLVITLSANAQIEDMEAAKKAAFHAAKVMDNALVSKHYDDYVSFNHPKVVEQAEGGRSGLVILIAKQITEIEESGNIITAIWPHMPTVVIDTAGEWQCTLDQFMEYRLPEGKVKAETTLIGISPDKGKTWYFLDAAGRNLQDLKTLFPTLSSQLVIQPPAEPIFTPDPKSTPATKGTTTTKKTPAPKK